MRIFIGADHRGFALKKKLIEHLQEKNIHVYDSGNPIYEPLDDFPKYAQAVSRAVLQNPKKNLGIVICGSAVGVSIACNRFHNIRCGLVFNQNQVKSAREHDHINIIALPADYISINEAKEIVDAFISTPFLNEEKYIRRLKQIEDYKIKEELLKKPYNDIA